MVNHHEPYPHWGITSVKPLKAASSVCIHLVHAAVLLTQSWQVGRCETDRKCHPVHSFVTGFSLLLYQSGQAYYIHDGENVIFSEWIVPLVGTAQPCSSHMGPSPVTDWHTRPTAWVQCTEMTELLNIKLSPVFPAYPKVPLVLREVWNTCNCGVWPYCFERI